MAAKTTLLDDLEKEIARLIKDTMKSHEATLTDKMKVLDRGLKLAQIKAKIDDDGDTQGFNDD